MSSGADLFVVCKQCGSEVSPYITECPYCGHRLRRRAPKLPRANGSGAPPRTRPGPYATIALVVAACALWVLLRGGFVDLNKVIVVGPLNGGWWKLFTSQFVYVNGLYAFVALGAIAIFGWLLERRHGPLVVLALSLGVGATGALAASAAYGEAVVSGGNGAALGLLAAWAVPDLRAARAGEDYEGDLLGTGAIAAALLAIPFALPEVSWLAGVSGGALGLLLGLGLARGKLREW